MSIVLLLSVSCRWCTYSPPLIIDNYGYLPTEMSKIHVTFDNRLKNVSPPICLSSLSYLIAFSVQFKTELNEWVSSRQLQQTPVANTQEHHFIMTW
ncbi:hypothetical protein PVAP13_2NG050914 [Panicum virgatum]|uniref:Secreted protein n=1 Tax=Panicum virgatum TaxID=38727 RepID=A0A8T0VGI8_PANVG|nr:hypothetical protein PVAP13_2NG050914 [Panicum virgatum]